jgi:hypothetical protein
VKRFDRLSQISQKFKPLGCDLDIHGPTVCVTSLSEHQFSLLKLVKHSSDVRSAGYQPTRDLQGRHRLGMSYLQDPQNVVLLGSQIPGLEKLVLKGLQPVVGSPQRKVHLLLERIKLSLFAGRLDFHHYKIVVQTTIVQTAIPDFFK